jgi:hypothetical protein
MPLVFFRAMRTSIWFALFGTVPIAAAGGTDPLHSPRWPDMHKLYIGADTVVFDDAVRVVARAGGT